MRNIVFVMVLSCCGLISAQELTQVETANKHYDSEQWEAAVKSFSALTLDNPTYGDYYYKLATSFRKQKQYKSSIKTYKKSLKIGYKKGRCIYFIASNYALLNNEDEALKWVNRGLKTPKSIYYSNLKTDPNFENLRVLPAFNNLYPQLLENATRLERWKTDLEFFKLTFETIHYNLHGQISTHDWNASIDEISKHIDELDDATIVVKLMQLVASVGDGHTFVRPPLQGDDGFHFYPIQLYQFEEGVFVTAINDKYADLVGSELTHIDGNPIAGFLNKFKTVLSVDNDMGYKENVYLMMFSEILQTLKITNNSTQASFTFKTPTQKSITRVIEASNFNPALWNTKLSSTKEALPLYRSNPNDYFWYKHLPEQNAVYLQLNINFSKPDKDIDEFYDEVFAFMDAEQVENLILDIRNCPGGNSFNNKELITHIIRKKSLKEVGNLYTIIGRKTFSAAMNLATDLEQWTNTIFIGEPTGSSPNFVGETNFVELPYSKLNISISNAYWQRSVSWDERHWIAPSIYIPPSIKAYRSNTDPVMDYILKAIKK